LIGVYHEVISFEMLTKLAGERPPLSAAEKIEIDQLLHECRLDCEPALHR